MISLVTIVGLAATTFAQSPPVAAAPPAPNIELALVPSAAAELEEDLSHYARADDSGLIPDTERGMPAVRETVLQASRRLINLRDHSVSSQRIVAVRTSIAAGQRQLNGWPTALSSSISRPESAL